MADQFLEPEAADPLLGTIFDEKYEIVSLLGKGGMSVVYQARHLLTNRNVALKLLYAYLSRDEINIRRFQQEAQTASAINHRNVIDVLDFGISPDNQPYLVMDLVTGKSIAELLEEKERIEYAEALDIFIQCCDGLAAAHDKQIVHRDIKPSNIVLLDSDGKYSVKIVDFGIAKMLDADAASSLRLTKTGEVFGSPLYMSPEQCQGGKVDQRSDIYSLGCVFYECLTGEPPIIGTNAIETMSKHIAELPGSFAKKAPKVQIPARLEELVFHMLVKDPHKRYQSLHTVAADLRKIAELGDGGIVATMSSKFSNITREMSRRRKVYWSIVAVCVLLLVGVAVYDSTLQPLIRQQLWAMNYAEGNKFYKEDNWIKAENKFVTALSLATKLKDHGSSESKTLELLSNVYEREGKFLKMANARNRRQTIIQEQLEKDYGVTQSDMDRMAEFALFHSPTVVESGKDKSYYEDHVVRLQAAAAICRQHHKNDKAEELIRRAISLKENICGESKTGLADLYGSLAVTCVRQKKLAEAEAHFIKALEIARKYPGENKRDLVHSLANVSLVYMERNDLEKARQVLAEAYNLANKDLPHEDPYWRELLSDYASYYDRTGNIEEEKRMLKLCRLLDAEHGATIERE